MKTVSAAGQDFECAFIRVADGYGAAMDLRPPDELIELGPDKLLGLGVIQEDISLRGGDFQLPRQSIPGALVGCPAVHEEKLSFVKFGKKNGHGG